MFMANVNTKEGTLPICNQTLCLVHRPCSRLKTVGTQRAILVFGSCVLVCIGGHMTHVSAREVLWTEVVDVLLDLA